MASIRVGDRVDDASGRSGQSLTAEDISCGRWPSGAGYGGFEQRTGEGLGDRVIAAARSVSGREVNDIEKMLG
jgi:hypothetical protein